MGKSQAFMPERMSIKICTFSLLVSFGAFADHNAQPTHEETMMSDGSEDLTLGENSDGFLFGIVESVINLGKKLLGISSGDCKEIKKNFPKQSDLAAVQCADLSDPPGCEKLKKDNMKCY